MAVQLAMPPQTVAAPGPPPSVAVVVGVADWRLSTDPHAHVVTYALGSCLGITFYDRPRRIGGLLHAMLPDSRLHAGKTKQPAMFIDTGVRLALNAMAKAGASVRELECKVFGGAQSRAADYFRIGSKNIEAFNALSAELSLKVLTWEVSGAVNRTIRLINQTGDIRVKVPGKPEFLC